MIPSSSCAARSGIRTTNLGYEALFEKVKRKTQHHYFVDCAKSPDAELPVLTETGISYMRNRTSRAFPLSSLSLGLLIASLCFAWWSRAIADDTSDCEAVNGVTPICGFKHPEDLEVMAGDRLMIVSELGSY